MKKKNIFLTIALSFIVLLTLTGCGSKTVITKEDFISKAQSHNYKIVDAIEQFAAYGHFESATIAISNDGWQTEFYVLDNESNAASMFNNNKAIFETAKGSASLESSSNIGNYSTYSLTSAGYYMYISRVDNTLVYLKVNETYKDAAKSFIKELGY